jgi:flagellar protein FliJ
MRSRDSLLRLNRFRVEDCRRQVADMDMMIADLMRKHDELDAHVKFEEQRTNCSDPNNVNYSMAAKAVRGRRDNMLKSVAELRDQREAAAERQKEAEGDLRKIELLVEKDAGGRAPMGVADNPQVVSLAR